LVIAAWAVQAATPASPGQPPAAPTWNWSEVSAFGTCAAAIIAAITVLISLHGIRKQINAAEKQVTATVKQLSSSVKASFLAKRPDVFIHLTTRYDELYTQLHRPGGAPLSDAELSHNVRAYWSLQLEQYQCYLEGFIDDEIYKYWMALRCQEYHDPQFTKVPEFQKKTDEALPDFHYEKFKTFMEMVFACWDSKAGGVSPLELEKATVEAKRRRREHLLTIDRDLPKHLGLD
jgi:hypothetical protein